MSAHICTMDQAIKLPFAEMYGNVVWPRAASEKGENIINIVICTIDFGRAHNDRAVMNFEVKSAPFNAFITLDFTRLTCSFTKLQRRTLTRSLSLSLSHTHTRTHTFSIIHEIVSVLLIFVSFFFVVLHLNVILKISQMNERLCQVKWPSYLCLYFHFTASAFSIKTIHSK